MSSVRSDCGSCVLAALQIAVGGGSGSWEETPAGSAVEHLAVAGDDPVLLAGLKDGTVQLYDLRCSQQPAARLRPHWTALVRPGRHGCHWCLVSCLQGSCGA